MGIAWISAPAHNQANQFSAVANVGTLGSVLRACRRLAEKTTFVSYIGGCPSRPSAESGPVVTRMGNPCMYRTRPEYKF